MRAHAIRRALQRVAWMASWLLAIASLAVVLLFAYVAVPVLVTRAQGGYAAIWFSGGGEHVVAAAALYLAGAGFFLARRRSARRRAGG